tara:strand:- start:3144 stop:5114 length:1971 start_codon:yes stop_codon:yes gene_type:complete
MTLRDRSLSASNTKKASGIYRATVTAVSTETISVKIPRLSGNIEYSDVSFYGDKPSVNDEIIVGFLEGNTGIPVALVLTGEASTLTGGGAAGDIEGVTAGLGLSGGGTTGTVSLAFAPSELSSVTVATDDKVVIADTSDSDNPKHVTVSSIAALATASPAGSDHQVQWNNNGSFGADANFTYDAANLTVKVPLTVGINGTGHDVKFFGDTTGKYMEWDESADALRVSGVIYAGAGTAGPILSEGTANTLRIDSGDGTIDIGAQNTDTVHMYTDRPVITWGTTPDGGSLDADLQLTASALYPYADNDLTLGLASKAWTNIYMKDGNASAPVYTFGSDVDTGFYLSGSGLSFTTAGTQRMYVSLAGRTHIPQIDDVDDDAVSGCLILGGDGTGQHLAFDSNEIQSKSDATTAATLNINLEGGTVKTKGELHVHHSGIAMTIQDTADDTGSYIQFTDTDSDQLGYIGCPNNDDIHIKNTNTSGYIYIGVSGATNGYCAYFTNTGDFLPYNNVEHNLGTDGKAWEHFYLGQGNTFSSGGYWTLRSRDDDRQVMEYTSSERFKKDIVDLPLSEAYQVLNARPIKFRGVDDDSSVPLEAGLSAESLHNAGYEYAVRYDEGHWGETPRSIYYDQLTAPLIKICKDQKDRIEALESKVAALESA